MILLFARPYKLLVSDLCSCTQESPALLDGIAHRKALYTSSHRLVLNHTQVACIAHRKFAAVCSASTTFAPAFGHAFVFVHGDATVPLDVRAARN